MEKGARKALVKDPVVINNPTRAGLSCLGAHAIYIYIRRRPSLSHCSSSSLSATPPDALRHLLRTLHSRAPLTLIIPKAYEYAQS